MVGKKFIRKVTGQAPYFTTDTSRINQRKPLVFRAKPSARLSDGKASFYCEVISDISDTASAIPGIIHRLFVNQNGKKRTGSSQLIAQYEVAACIYDFIMKLLTCILRVASTREDMRLCVSKMLLYCLWCRSKVQKFPSILLNSAADRVLIRLWSCYSTLEHLPLYHT